MAPDRTFVIVGASLCGAKAAETLRDEGFDGRVVLIGDEADRPYERPPLSKTYLRGESTFDDAAVHALDYYEAHGIELCTVDHRDRRRPRRPPKWSSRQGSASATTGSCSRPARRRAVFRYPGRISPGSYYLRTVQDSELLHNARHLLGAGGRHRRGVDRCRGGRLGPPARCRRHDGRSRVASPSSGCWVQRSEASTGTCTRPTASKLRLGVGIESIGGTECVEEVRLSDGTVLPAGVVVAGVGVHAANRSGRGSRHRPGQRCRRPTSTSRRARRVSTPPGTSPTRFHPLYGRRIRLEHWSAALNQGPVGREEHAREPTPYDRTPYFYSDQYDLGMEYRGWAPEFDQVVFRGDPASGEFLAFWLQRSQVVAAMNANVWDQSEAIDALVGGAQRSTRRVSRIPTSSWRRWRSRAEAARFMCLVGAAASTEVGAGPSPTG